MLADIQEATHRPKSGKTARVWEIADEISRQTGRIAQRRDVIERFQAEGGNANTASTQYSQWKSAFVSSGANAELEARPGNTDPIRLAVAPDGRLLIPVDLRSAMMIDATGTVTARVVDGELRVITPACALDKVQELVAAIDKGEGSVVEELLRERRADAALEGGK